MPNENINLKELNTGGSSISSSGYEENEGIPVDLEVESLSDNKLQNENLEGGNHSDEDEDFYKEGEERENTKGVIIQDLLDQGFTWEQLGFKLEETDTSFFAYKDGNVFYSEKKVKTKVSLGGIGGFLKLVAHKLYDFFVPDEYKDIISSLLGDNWNFMTSNQKYNSMITAYKFALKELENSFPVKDNIYYTEKSKLLHYLIAYGKASKAGSIEDDSIKAQRRFIQKMENELNSFLSTVPKNIKFQVIDVDFSEIELDGLLYRGWNEKQKQILQGSYIAYGNSIGDRGYSSENIFLFPWYYFLLAFVLIYYFFKTDKI